MKYNLKLYQILYCLKIFFFILGIITYLGVINFGYTGYITDLEAYFIIIEACFSCMFFFCISILFDLISGFVYLRTHNK